MRWLKLHGNGYFDGIMLKWKTLFFPFQVMFDGMSFQLLWSFPALISSSFFRGHIQMYSRGHTAAVYKRSPCRSPRAENVCWWVCGAGLPTHHAAGYFLLWPTCNIWCSFRLLGCVCVCVGGCGYACLVQHSHYRTWCPILIQIFFPLYPFLYLSIGGWNNLHTQTRI